MSLVRAVPMLTFAAALLGALPAVCAPAPAWTVDKQASRLAFAGEMNGQRFNGAFRRWDAKIAFDPKNLAGSSVLVTVDAASAVTGDATRDEALPSDDWFAAKAFPNATFAARSFKDLGGGRYQAIGVLTLRGVARPLVLPFQLSISGPVAKMQARLVLNRAAFGVGRGQFAGPEPVALQVPLDISVTARR